jgi:hypothetical protein
MNLFVAMIPFLLMCASFYTVSVVNASVPVESEAGDSDIAKGEDKITLAVEVRRGTGFKISLQSDTLGEATLDQLETDLPLKGGNFDYEALADYSLFLKEKYPKSDTAMVLPEREVTFEVIVGTMDAVREKVTMNGKEEVHTVLFPSIVLSGVGAGDGSDAAAKAAEESLKAAQEAAGVGQAP